MSKKYRTNRNKINIPGVTDLLETGIGLIEPLWGGNGMFHFEDVPSPSDIVGDLTGVNQMEEIAQGNLELGRDVFNYQKELQQTIFQREDNSMQRRVADLRAAGLNPILAAGGPGAGAGAAIPVTTPRKDVVRGPDMLGAALNIASLMSAKVDIAKTLMDTKLAAVNMGKFEAETDNILADTRKKEIENDIRAHDRDIIKDSGMVEKASSPGKGVRDMGSVLRRVLKELFGEDDDKNKRSRPAEQQKKGNSKLRKEGLKDSEKDFFKSIEEARKKFNK